MSYTALLPSLFDDRWHDGTGQITYSFPTTVPSYYTTKVDTNGDGVLDAIKLYSDNQGDVDIPLSVTNFSPQPTDLAVAAVAAWNEVANIHLVPLGASTGVNGGVPVTGNGTLVSNLGGATGFGEDLVPRADDSPSLQVNLDSIFPDGLNLFGTTYHSLYININGSVSFGSPVTAFTPTSISAGLTPMIAPFWADVDTRLDTTDPINHPPQVVYDFDYNNRVFTVTWPGVDHYDATSSSHVPQANFFQLQLYDRGVIGSATRGDDFDIVFRYQSIGWTKGEISSEPAHAGWTAGDGAHYEQLSASGHDAALTSLPSTIGNTGQPGLWVFAMRDGDISVGDINFSAFNFIDETGAAETNTFGATGSHFVFPTGTFETGTPGTPSPDGDIWLNLNMSVQQPGDPQATVGGSGYLTYLHELGHALGLLHPGGNGFNPAYNMLQTVMSYNAGAAGFPITPMVLDIQAIQSVYGANTSTRNGNTTYFGPGANAYAMDNLGLIPAGQPGAGNTMELTIWDGGGFDTISAVNQTQSCLIDLNPGHYSRIGATFTNVAIAELATGEPNWIEAAIGGSANDNITGNDKDNSINGGPGNDIMAGGKGNDIYGVDAAGDMVTEAFDEGTDTVMSSATYALGANVEHLTLIGTSAIDGTGNDQNNIIIGNDFNNAIDGGVGADDMRGGLGNDSFVVDDIGDSVTERDNEGTDTVFSAITFTLGAFVENLTLIGGNPIDGFGNDGSNTLVGNGANNILDGLAGADTMRGGAGNDSYAIDVAGDAVVENPGEGFDTVVAAFNYTLLPDFESLILTGSAVVGTGNAAGNVIYGQFSGSVDNILNGGLGADEMHGFAGNDIYIVDNPADAAVENPGEGIDTVQTTLATYLLPANIDNLIFADDGTHTGTGNVLANAMFGGNGNDTFFADAGTDTLTGGGGDDVLVGNADIFASEADVLNGGDGNDTIFGEVSDTINGGAGTDFLFAVNANPWSINLGATSIEWMLAGFGNDTIDASTQTVGVTVYGSGGNDVIAGSVFADNLWGGAGNDTLTGNDGNDLLFGDVDADSLSGGAGNDIIYAEGADTLIDGGTGTDAFYWRAGTNANIDIAALSVEFVQTLGDDDTLNGASSSVGLVVFAGAGTDTVTGGSGVDFLWGEAGNDIISGNGGNDTLVGGAGADRLTGGTGTDNIYGNLGGGGDGAADVYAFGPSWGTDFVYDFDNGTDHFDMTALATNFANLTITNSGPHAQIAFSGNLIVVVNGAGLIDQSDFLL